MAHGKVNAMSLEFCEALTARFAEIWTARAVVMTATGRTFSAGVDLVRLLEGGAPYIRKFLPALSTMFAAVFSHPADRKSTRLNSSHLGISYAVFCLKKKKCRNKYYITAAEGNRK